MLFFIFMMKIHHEFWEIQGKNLSVQTTKLQKYEIKQIQENFILKNVYIGKDKDDISALFQSIVPIIYI